ARHDLCPPDAGGGAEQPVRRAVGVNAAPRFSLSIFVVPARLGRYTWPVGLISCRQRGGDALSCRTPPPPVCCCACAGPANRRRGGGSSICILLYYFIGPAAWAWRLRT